MWRSALIMPPEVGIVPQMTPTEFLIATECPLYTVQVSYRAA